MAAQRPIEEEQTDLVSSRELIPEFPGNETETFTPAGVNQSAAKLE